MPPYRGAAPYRKLSPEWDRAVSDSLPFIRSFEGFKSHAYPDHGQWSIGYGSKARDRNEVIDRAEGERRLREEAYKKAVAIEHKFDGIRMTPAQRAALLSRAYNAGEARVNKIARLMRSGNMAAAEQEMLTITTAAGKQLPGLVNRRHAELDLFRGIGKFAMAVLRKAGKVLVVAGDTFVTGVSRTAGRLADLLGFRRHAGEAYHAGADASDGGRRGHEDRHDEQVVASKPSTGRRHSRLYGLLNEGRDEQRSPILPPARQKLRLAHLLGISPKGQKEVSVDDTGITLGRPAKNTPRCTPLT